MFFPLRLRSHYSLMQGTASPAKLCRLAKKAGYSGLALTDLNNLYGLWSFLAACKKEGLRPVIGADIDDDGGHRLTALVENEKGYKNLCQLLTGKHLDTDFELVRECADHGEGLLFLSDNRTVLAGLQRAGLSVSADLGAQPDARASRLRSWARSRRIASLCTPAAVLGGPDEQQLFQLLRAIDEKKSLSQIRSRSSNCTAKYLEHPDVYADRFAIWPEVLKNSELLAARCRFRGPDFGIIMPPWRGRGESGTVLRRKAYEGAVNRYGEDLAEPVVERLEHELKVICKMAFASYFLVVRDIVHRLGTNGVRKKRRICGRGSGAASLVAYCLEITNVCPVKHNLYFERFLNPGRSDPPDIDIDFSWDERDHVLAEVLHDFNGHIAMVANHVCFQPKMAIRETARAHGLSSLEISTVTKRLPWYRGHGTSMAASVAHLPTMRGIDLSPPWPSIFKQAEQLVGVPRYLSVHPGGVVITPQPINHYVPVERAAKGVPIIHWEKDGTEEAGLVKIDLLGNRSLGVIRDGLGAVRGCGVEFDETNWQPEDDPATRVTVANGLTMGCFYIESPAMRLLQKKAAVGDFEQLVIQSSIIRPAANEFVREYVRRLHGGRYDQLHPLLTDVLDETYGLMVYQEDVSRVAVRLASFSHARADGLRKVLSKKDREMRLPDYRQEFFSGCRQNGIEQSVIEDLWRMILSFDGYSFCKPHSASYAKVSFQAAYLKCHFPAQFMAAVISNEGGFYSTFAYVSETRRLGLTIVPPCVNESTRKWSGEGSVVRVGLMALKGLSRGLVERVISCRLEGAYRNPADFFVRTSPSTDEVRALIHSGALDCVAGPLSRSQLLWECARLNSARAAERTTPLLGFSAPPPPELKDGVTRERLRREYAILGFLTSCHPVSLMPESILAGRVRAIDLEDHTSQKVRFVGWLITGKLVSTKNGEVMEFLTFEDETGLVETTFFPRTYQRYAHLLSSGRPYVLHGTIDRDFGAVSLVVNRVSLVRTT
ncbi:MAG: DNA polymerase III subunit alpha [Thermodesulfobacteriota bacterium]